MRIRLGISACLLGQKVRYDGGHKLDHSLADTPGDLVEYVPVCPEVEAGLGVPREAMRLTGDPRWPRLTVIATGEDVSGRMQAWMGDRLRRLAAEKLDGFILKCRSPSCGPAGVLVQTARGESAAGEGLFAKALREALPAMPIAADEELREAGPRERFFARAGAGRKA